VPLTDCSAFDTLRSCWPRITPRYGLLRCSALGTPHRLRIAPYSTLSAPRKSRIAPLSTACTLHRSRIVPFPERSVLSTWLSVPVYGFLRTLTLCAPRAKHGLLHVQHFKFRPVHGLLHVRHLALCSDHGYLRAPHSTPGVAHGCLRAQHLRALHQVRSTPLPTLIAPPRTGITPGTTLGFSVPSADCSALFT
jgi:hypothetical protein